MKPRVTELEQTILAKFADADVVTDVGRCGGAVVELGVSALTYELVERLARAAGTDIEGYVAQALTEAVKRGEAVAA